MLALSVLDQSVVVAGSSEADAIRGTVDLARACDALGFHRFWVSEHHNNGTIVGSAPEVLMAAIATQTRRIRVGSAGVMLPHYSAYKVAEQFRVLDALAPGRIDLGVGRAPGSDGLAAMALNPYENAGAFPDMVRELRAWVSGRGLPAGHRFAQVEVHPIEGAGPELWMLGSSDYGSRLAAQLGLPYAFAHFITDGFGAEAALRGYRDSFRPSEDNPQPRAGLCVWALVADTDAEAHRLFASRAWAKAMRERGYRGPLLSPEDAAAFAYSAPERAYMDRLRADALIGTAADVGARLRALAKDCAADEIVVVTWTHDAAARLRSYQLLAQEFGLMPG